MGTSAAYAKASAHRGSLRYGQGANTPNQSLYSAIYPVTKMAVFRRGDVMDDSHEGDRRIADCRSESPSYIFEAMYSVVAHNADPYLELDHPALFSNYLD